MPLWFVETAELDATPAANTLVAFSGSGVSDGSVLDAPTVLSRGLTAADQVGAIRWWIHSGQIHQVYVAPERRRQGIATALIHAAAGARAARGWPSLRADGQRTDLGEDWAQAGPNSWRHRVEPRTHDLPPMTPTQDGPANPAGR